MKLLRDSFECAAVCIQEKLEQSLYYIFITLLFAFFTKPEYYGLSLTLGGGEVSYGNRAILFDSLLRLVLIFLLHTIKKTTRRTTTNSFTRNCIFNQ